MRRDESREMAIQSQVTVSRIEPRVSPGARSAAVRPDHHLQLTCVKRGLIASLRSSLDAAVRGICA